MMSSRVLVQSLLKKKVPNLAVVNHYSTERDVFGTREWVCHGINGSKHYADRRDFPMPAIRWKEVKGDLVALKEKEKGDWKKLSLDERKALYRASFCQTFAEFEAPTGQWKYIWGGTFLGIGITIAYFTLIKLYAGPPLPSSFTEENRAKNLRHIIDLEYGVGLGAQHNWDYEKNDWKK